MIEQVRAREVGERAAAATRSRGRASSATPPAAGLLGLQRLAGNRAVSSLFVQRRVEAGADEVTHADLGVSPADAVDSALPEEAVGAAPSVQTVVETIQESPIQRVGGGEPILQRVAHRCPAYDGYSAALPLASYNCAGLAHRSYDYKQLPAVNALLGAGQPASAGVVGKIKHWLWNYDVRIEDSAGRRTSPSPDFHTVAGEIGTGAADPTDVYSKNGKRRIYGPGTGLSFKPAARERALENTPQEAPATDSNGQPLYKLRENMTERVVVLNCPSSQPPLQGPPTPS
jgi:hypothetical protein